MAGNFNRKLRLPRVHFRVLLHARKYATWDKRLYFPSERRRAEDFFSLKNPTASAGFEPANLGTKGQHAISRPPKPLNECHCEDRHFYGSTALEVLDLLYVVPKSHSVKTRTQSLGLLRTIGLSQRLQVAQNTTNTFSRPDSNPQSQ